MSKISIITGLDIGTSVIKILIAAKRNDNELEIISHIKVPSCGIRKGVVIDVDSVSKIINSLISQAKIEYGKTIDSVYVNVGGSHLFSLPSHGTVAVSRADQKVSQEDVDRVIQAAQTFSLSSNKEIFDAVVREFIVDGENGIKEPIGLQGVRLEADVLTVGGFSPYLNNLNQTVLNSNLQISDRIPSPVASARACLTAKQMEQGAVLIDIGAGTAGLAVFEEGDLIHLSILPMGSNNITNDIAIGLKTDIDIAERIKIEYGTCVKEKSQKKEKVEIGEEEPLVFSRHQLLKIINARVSEIFSEINKQLKSINRQGLLPAGVVLTGGGARLPKIIELAKKEFKLPCRIGKPQGFPSLQDDPSLSTVCGLVLGGIDTEEDGGGGKSAIGEGFSKWFKKILKNFIP